MIDLIAYPARNAEPPQANVAARTSIVAGSNQSAVESAPSNALPPINKYLMRAL